MGQKDRKMALILLGNKIKRILEEELLQVTKPKIKFKNDFSKKDVSP
jgi:hypothetical protein